MMPHFIVHDLMVAWPHAKYWHPGWHRHRKTGRQLWESVKGGTLSMGKIFPGLTVHLALTTQGWIYIEIEKGVLLLAYHSDQLHVRCDVWLFGRDNGRQRISITNLTKASYRSAASALQCPTHLEDSMLHPLWSTMFMSTIVAFPCQTTKMRHPIRKWSGGAGSNAKYHGNHNMSCQLDEFGYIT